MRLLALLSISAAAVFGLASCGESGPPELEACADTSSAPIRSAPGARQPLLGVLYATPNAPAVLARLDPLSLKPVSRQVEIGEYHPAWSLSPDGSQLALARGGQGIGIEIVELKAMKLVRDVHTGIAAEALGWLAPRRLVAGLQRGGTVLVDPVTGRIRRRWPGFSFPDESARLPDALVMLLPQLRKSSPNLPLTRVAGAPRLAVVDRQGRLRSVTLKRIRLDARFANGVYYEDRAALAVDPARARAYIFAADAPVTEVDLRTMRVSYHRELAGPEIEGKNAPARQRHALWLGGGKIAVFGRDLSAAKGKLAATPAGVTLIDTRDWSACTLDARASGAAFAVGRVLTYGPGSAVSRDEAGVGFRAFTVGGAEAFHLFDGQQVWDVETASGRAYVRSPDAVHVVDVRTGKAVGKITPPPELADVIGGSA